MISFHYQPDSEHAIDTMAEQLSSALAQGKRVVWLVCGGSNIPWVVACMNRLPTADTGTLTICLTDERYGIPGHTDSNWTQLDEAGFDRKQATIIPTLEADTTLQDTCQHYGAAVTAALDQAELVVAQFGIGGDGHIAGILPNSPAVDSPQPAVGYDAGKFMRITLTPSVLRRIDSAYALVYGETKRHALEQLRDQNLPLTDQPAQILKEIDDAHVYSDQFDKQENV